MLLAELSEANTRLASFALIDALTDLPNRRAITDTLACALGKAQRDGTRVLVGLVDMDGFKSINDTHGHQVGDLFLQEIGRRLRGGLRTMDAVGRLGGDEFGIVVPCPACDGEAAAQSLQARITAATTGDYQLKEVSFAYAGASVGVVVIDPLQIADAEEAFRLADAQMYRIKRLRRNQLIAPVPSPVM
ncbi:GGDEF domain-containing protein [Candidatus Dactylopiibacterium carminicum]|uniref:GGDEF domain-containing protein n=1 Tax=Candidatus Dactylopiibacterium carminicum TaxID=857335 RepID=UPI001CC28AF1|nr:GGDEF domain-containing protein [Candidatus Dactylopiibacterium carminicum]